MSTRRDSSQNDLEPNDLYDQGTDSMMSQVSQSGGGSTPYGISGSMMNSQASQNNSLLNKFGGLVNSQQAFQPKQKYPIKVPGSDKAHNLDNYFKGQSSASTPVKIEQSQLMSNPPSTKPSVQKQSNLPQGQSLLKAMNMMDFMNISSKAEVPQTPLKPPGSVIKEQSEESPSSGGRVNAMMKNYERHVNEKWRKALRHLGINENLFPNKREEIETFFPFNECSIANIQGNMFLSRQLQKIILEITSIDVVNQCFYVKFRDLNGEEIFGVFHSDCKERIKQDKMRKGSVVILNNVSITPQNLIHPSILSLKGKCE